MTGQQFLSTPKAIHLPCTLLVAHRLFFRGETRELSEHEASVQIPALVFPGMQKPEHGVSCVLTLNKRSSGGLPTEILKIPCRVVYVATILIGLNLNTEELDEHQHRIFDTLLEMKV
jgi:hypothetical protein